MADNDIIKHLDRIAEGIERISAEISKPENKIKKAMELAGYGITVLGAVSIADIIRNWIIGGNNGFSINFICSCGSTWADRCFPCKKNKVIMSSWDYKHLAIQPGLFPNS